MSSLFRVCLLLCFSVAVSALTTLERKTRSVKQGTLTKTTVNEEPHDHDYPYKATADCRDIIDTRRCQTEDRRQRICLHPEKSKLCKKTCHRCHLKVPSPKIPCAQSLLGCCWDGVTTRQGRYNEGCPKCEDDADFAGLCTRWHKHCHSEEERDKTMRDIVQKYCHLTCGKCGNTRVFQSNRKYTLPPIAIQESHSDNKPRSGAKYIWTKVKNL